MGRRMRTRARNRESKNHELYSAAQTLGIKFIRAVSFREGDELVKQGKARHIWDDTSNRVAFQLLAESKKAAAVVESQSRASCPVPTRVEAEAAIGFYGQSGTEGLTKAQRAQLEAVNRPAHDFIERAKVKLDAFKPVRSGSTERVVFVVKAAASR